MKRLELNEEQADELAIILEGFLGDLRMEIANTDQKDFRDRLKRREDFIKMLLTQLRGG